MSAIRLIHHVFARPQGPYRLLQDLIQPTSLSVTYDWLHSLINQTLRTHWDTNVYLETLWLCWISLRHYFVFIETLIYAFWGMRLCAPTEILKAMWTHNWIFGHIIGYIPIWVSYWVHEFIFDFVDTYGTMLISSFVFFIISKMFLYFNIGCFWNLGDFVFRMWIWDRSFLGHLGHQNPNFFCNDLPPSRRILWDYDAPNAPLFFSHCLSIYPLFRILLILISSKCP